MARYTVEKCICHGNSFEELKTYAQKHNINDVEELQGENLCSCSCKMCLPYIELMLETGQTVFEPGEPYGRAKKN